MLIIRLFNTFELSTGVNDILTKTAHYATISISVYAGFRTIANIVLIFLVFIPSCKKTDKLNNCKTGDAGNGDTAVVIPLAVPGENHIGAFIVGTVTDDVSLKLLRQSDYAAFPFQSTTTAGGITTAEDFALKMMVMDNQVFGIKEFEIKDKRLFNPTADYRDTAGKRVIVKFGDAVITGGNGYSTNNLLQTICVTLVYQTLTPHCGTPNYSGCIPTCDRCSSYCADVVQLSYSTQCTSWFVPEEGGWPVFAPGGGGSGGVGTPPPCVLNNYLIASAIPPGCNPAPTPNPWPAIPPIISSLQSTLNLNTAQATWLSPHLNSATQIFNYLELNTTATRIDIIKEHLDLSISNPAYFTFASAYTSTNGIMWWEDEPWLKQRNYEMPEEAFNFYMEVTKPKTKKPQEFASKCEGIEFVSQASKNDSKERAGYITLDGKFIFTNTGSACGVAGDLSIKIKNGQAYYCYKKTWAHQH